MMKGKVLARPEARAREDAELDGRHVRDFISRPRRSTFSDRKCASALPGLRPLSRNGRKSL